eukprot:COSAG06_NODE_167_length_21546_cov_35.001352_20_plen_60_part_00
MSVFNISQVVDSSEDSEEEERKRQEEEEKLLEEARANSELFEPFIYKNAHLTKTGSGQT